jgi:plasmid maintenance system killer protein
MDQGRTVKEVFESKAGGSKRRVRPRLRWLEDVEKDLREMKVKRWRQKAGDREEWVSVIKEAKAL